MRLRRLKIWSLSESDSYAIGDTITFVWRGKTRKLVIDLVVPELKTVFGIDPKTGKCWQCTYEDVTGLVERPL